MVELESSEAAELARKLDLTQIPAHVAIIMDGNGRWAAARNKPRVWGHRHGARRVRTAVELSGKLGVRALTLFAFSEENWGRPTFEVNALMSLLDSYILSERQQLDEQNVQFRVLGEIERLPRKTRDLVQETVALLAKNDGLVLNIALSYGSRQEIVRACQKAAELVRSGDLLPSQLNVEMLESFLDTSNLPDPDLLIRTSGEQRLSNFLLWQSAYTELYFTNVHWPDFGEREYIEALLAFQHRDRRFGLVRKGSQAGEGRYRREVPVFEGGDSPC